MASIADMLTNLNGATTIAFQSPFVCDESQQLSSWRAKYSLPDDERGDILSLIIAACCAVCRADGHPELPDSDQLSWDADVQIMTEVGHDDLEPATTRRIAALKVAYPNRYAVAIPLIACHSVRRLSPANIQGFFVQSGLPRFDVASLIAALDSLSPYAKNLLNAPATLAYVRSTTWGSYHSAVGSTGSVCARVVSDLGTLSAVVFSAVERQAVAASDASRQDIKLARAIPRRVVLICALYLDVNGVLPDGWITGQREIDGSPASKVNGIRMFFKAAKRLATSQDRLDAATDIRSLVHAMPQYLIADEGQRQAMVQN